MQSIVLTLSQPSRLGHSDPKQNCRIRPCTKRSETYSLFHQAELTAFWKRTPFYQPKPGPATTRTLASWRWWISCYVATRLCRSANVHQRRSGVKEWALPIVWWFRLLEGYPRKLLGKGFLVGICPEYHWLVYFQVHERFQIVRSRFCSHVPTRGMVKRKYWSSNRVIWRWQERLTQIYTEHQHEKPSTSLTSGHCLVQQLKRDPKTIVTLK